MGFHAHTEAENRRAQAGDAERVRRVDRFSDLLPDLPRARRFGEYPNTGAIRYVYYTILITHVLLAFTVPVLAIITLKPGATRGKFDKHRRIARWTFPIWLYVSVTGVVVYLMLYQFANPVIPDRFTSSLVSTSPAPLRSRR